jgi:tetratricopeptide (TPR) repeat protein
MTSPGERAAAAHRLAAAGLIGAVAFALYAPSRDAELVDLDDRVMVVQDHARHRAPSALLDAFRSGFYDTYYRPLHRISFVIDARLSGTDLRGYHRTNAVLHAAGSMAVFGALLALGYGAGVAASCGLVFAVHPALVSAVAWIPGRDNVLLTLFLLGGLVAWARYLAARGARPAAAAWLGLHWLLLAGALLTKEAALVFPAVLLAFAWLWPGEARWRRLAPAALGWLGLLLLFGVLRARALPDAPGWQAVGADALARSWPAAFALLGKLVLPLRLSAFSSLELVSVASGLAAALAVAALTVRSRLLRRPRVAFGALWFGILLAPTLVQRTGLYDYGEYRLYWLAFGPLIVAAELLRGLRLERRRALGLVALALLTGLLAARSLAYQRAFDGPLRFWTRMVEVDPGSGWGWFQIGRTHHARGELEPALAAYERARSLDFERVELYADLSAARLEAGDAPGAAAAAERALALAPGQVHALANLGMARLQLGDARAAVEALDAALDPRDTDQFRHASPGERDAFRARVHEQLGTARYALGERDAAEREWTLAIELDPARHGAYLKLIETALVRGDLERAERLAAALRREGGRLPTALRARLSRARHP